ncbi:MAG: glycosyltransferase [Candidatus Cloacimonetes bacterium]|nr:glycosyltransferase [Candidatus Cloacimonadota bacterium]
MNIAIVHDDFMQWGGAERLVLAMAEIWPDAPIYTAIYDESVLPKSFPKSRLVPSFLQGLPLSKTFYRQLFFLHPLAFESFNFNEFDVVLSSTTRFAKSVITQPQTLHICYCNTPPRFLWMTKNYLQTKNFNPLLWPFYRLILLPLLSYLRLHDQTAAQRVDFFIANSRNVAARIKKYYNREPTVIYPFVELARFAHIRMDTNENSPSVSKPIRTKNSDYSNLDKLGYFLVVSRLGGHKRVDLAIEAFNKLGWQLKIVGTGPEEKKYKKMAKANIEFLGQISDEKVVYYYQNCTAFIYPQEEDFGITALEAMAAGKPVIAFKGGGALETVVPGTTGEFFYPQSTDALISVLKNFNPMKYDSTACHTQAEKFSRERFAKELKVFIETKHQKRYHHYG